MMVTMLLAAGWLVASLAPETPIGAALHRWLVAKPAALLNRITRGQVLLTLGMALLILGSGWLGQDVLNAVAMGSPELMAAFASVELSVWVDGVAGALLSWSAVRGMRLARRIAPRRSASRARRTRRPAAHRPAANDADDGHARRAA